MGKNTADEKHWLAKCYGKSGPAHLAIKYRFTEFPRNRTSSSDTFRKAKKDSNAKKHNEVKLCWMAVMVIMSKKKVIFSFNKRSFIVNEVFSFPPTVYFSIRGRFEVLCGFPYSKRISTVFFFWSGRLPAGIDRARDCTYITAINKISLSLHI